MTTPVGSSTQTPYKDPTYDYATGTGITASSTAAAASSETQDNSTLSSQAFLQLLVAQLKYQDPSQPMDTSTFMSETATLSQVQSTTAATTTSNSMLAAMNAQEASSLVGKSITYTNAANGISTGIVASANISTSTPTLAIAGSSDVIGLTSVEQVVGATRTSPTT
jgi:flagellar basal-body rod modification protein FlgD